MFLSTLFPIELIQPLPLFIHCLFCYWTCAPPSTSSGCWIVGQWNGVGGETWFLFKLRLILNWHEQLACKNRLHLLLLVISGGFDSSLFVSASVGILIMRIKVWFIYFFCNRNKNKNKQKDALTHELNLSVRVPRRCPRRSFENKKKKWDNISDHLLLLASDAMCEKVWESIDWIWISCGASFSSSTSVCMPMASQPWAPSWKKFYFGNPVDVKEEEDEEVR